MPWIPITEANLQNAISGVELDSLRDAARAHDEADPVAPAIARVVSRIRGDVATSGKYDLHPDLTRIPDRLLDAALALITMRIMSRPGAAVIDDDGKTRARAADAAERLLERVAKGDYAITDPDTGRDNAGNAIRTVSSQTRHFTRDKMKGL